MPDNVAVTVETSLNSETEAGVRTSATVGRVSSSVRVSAAPVTAPAPCPLASAPVTVAPRPAEPWWTSSSTAVTNTVSAAAVVAPAAMVMVASVPTVKRPEAPEPAVTVTVDGSLDGCESVAVTVAMPPFSDTDPGSSDSAAVGAASSSRTVSGAPVTVMVVESAVARALVMVAVTVPARSGSSVVLFAATTVAVSEAAVVAPAAMTMAASVPAAQAVPAATVTVVAAPEACDSRAVTVATLPVPLSAMLDGDSARVTPGGPSSSVVVTDTSELSRRS